MTLYINFGFSSKEEFNKAYKSWNKIKNKNLLSPQWEDREIYYDWLLKNNFNLKSIVKRKDTTQLFCEDNCYLYSNLENDLLPLKKCWQSLITRNKNFICDEWLNFDNYSKWAIDNNWQVGRRLNRKNTNDKFCPDNCYFSDKIRENISSTKVEFNGKSMTLTEISQLPDCEVNYKILVQRIIRYGIQPEKAIKNENCRGSIHCDKLITIYGESKTIKEWSKDERCKVSYAKLIDRIIYKNIHPKIALENDCNLNKLILTPNIDVDLKDNIKYFFDNYQLISEIAKTRKIKGIYSILNLINGKVYIGQSSSKIGINQRIRQHLSLLKKGKHDSKHLQMAWEKYGEYNFAFFIIEEAENDLNIKEKQWIAHYKSDDNKFGYNTQSEPGQSNLGKILKPISEDQIINWIVEYKNKHGEFPKTRSGLIGYSDDPKLTWKNIDHNLRYGLCGLQNGSSLKKLIETKI